jgi:hypothetical protein
MSENCPIIQCCPLRVYYAGMGDGSKWEKRFCLADYESCARYKFEAIADRVGCPPAGKAGIEFKAAQATDNIPAGDAGKEGKTHVRNRSDGRPVRKARAGKI